MSEDQTPTSPAAELVAVVEDLVTRQRQILDAIVTGRPPSRDSVQAVLLGMRGVVTKLRNGAAEAVPTTPTNPDLREQIQRVLRERCEVEDRQYTDGTGWVLVRDDNAAQVVADYFAPVLEGLRAELDAALIQREAQAEVEQWRATFGETALRDATAIIAERDALRAQLENAVVLPFDSRNQIEQMLRDIATTGNPTGTAAQVMRLLMSWKSAAKEAL